MSYFRDSMEACDALLEKHGNIARRAPGLFPEERARLERQDLIVKPVPVPQKRALAQQAVALAAARRRGRGRPMSEAMKAAVAEYEAMPPALRHRRQRAVARKHGVSSAGLNVILRRRAFARALAENSAHPKLRAAA